MMMNTMDATDTTPFTVVLTRPAGQSAVLMAKLSARGIGVVDFPLLAIEPPSDGAPLRAALGMLERYALVVFVSPNAVERAFAHDAACALDSSAAPSASSLLSSSSLSFSSPAPDWPRSLPIAAVGPASVAALAQHGVVAPDWTIISPNTAPDDEAARFDSEALYAALEKTPGMQALQGRRVLIVRGEGGRAWLAERLREAGAEVETVAAYRRVKLQPSDDAWARVRALLAGEPHAWLVTSSESMRHLDALAHECLSADENVALRKATLVVPHPRIAEMARDPGFDRIIVCGVGDEHVEAKLFALASVVQSAQSTVRPASFSSVATATPSHMTAMTEQNAFPDAHAKAPPAVSADAAASTVSSAASAAPAPVFPASASSSRLHGGMPVWLLWFVVLAALAAAGAGGYALNRKVDRIGQRQQTGDAQLHAQVNDVMQQTGAQIETLKNRLGSDETSQQALAQQYAGLVNSRNDWVIAEVSQMLMGASEQLALTGNTKLALATLQNADARLAASNSAPVLTVRKAIASDINKLKIAPSIDLTGLALKLDSAIGQIDALPLAGEAPVAHQAPKATSSGEARPVAHEPRWKAWLRQFTSEAGRQLASLVEVRRIDNADAMLVSPKQDYFVRENLKLRLLSARASLLSHNEATLKVDLQEASATLARYFDPDAKSTQAVRDLLKQVQDSANAITLPDLDDSLHAIQQYQNRG